MSNLSKREEIAARLAAAILQNTDALTRAHAERIPHITAQLADQIIEECDAFAVAAANRRANA
jgi:hypothetical protein